ncbi:hypothetical protein OS493_026863 [Desmophyllum pertusum]|uniref:Uncharacterized protein n=1 Tax=Desmophyllum pertusum TaxID=174260 RepID=A0A9X0CX88_9CNID|nr:hypothetical protein OS493_026863 [Desmophyllum pertusum]
MCESGDSEQSNDLPTDEDELIESRTVDTDEISLHVNNESTIDECDVTRTHDVYENLTGKLVTDQGCQTLYSKYELSAKVETMILKNEVSTTIKATKIVSTLSYENIVRDPGLTKHFIGLTPPQFEVMHDFLDDVCPLETINYHCV